MNLIILGSLLEYTPDFILYINEDKMDVIAQTKKREGDKPEMVTQIKQTLNNNNPNKRRKIEANIGKWRTARVFISSTFKVKTIPYKPISYKTISYKPFILSSINSILKLI